MNNIFERCKAIPAHAVAAREGIKLRKRGDRFWSQCPFHPDKTPSLCYFPDGGFKCFSCGAGGDSAGFLAKLKGIAPLEAAKLITGDSTAKYTPQPRQRTAADDRAEKHREYCRIKHDANATMTKRIEAVGSGPDIMEDEAFTTAFNAYWWADDCLENLDTATEDERLAGWKGWAHE